VDDVVDLDEVLAAALVDELRCQVHVLEAVEVALVHVRARPAVDQPLGHRLGDARGVGDPHRLGDPESAYVTGVPQDREAVGGEGEDAVEALLHLAVGKRGQQVEGGLPRVGEVLLGERQHRGHDGRLGRAEHVVHVDGHRAVAVVADADPVAVLPVVQVAVLVAQDRLARLQHLVAVAGQRGHRAGLGVLVGQRQQGDGEADHAADLRPPEAGAGDDDVGGVEPLVGLDAGDPAAGTQDPGYSGIERDLDAPAAMRFGEEP
jgi:hypothetical protein